MKKANAYLIVALVLLASCLMVRAAINPNDIPRDTRRQWCEQQVASCPLLCADQNEKNTAETNWCKVATLEYQCVCNNGFQPNAKEYTQTIEYFTCTQEVLDCKNNCNSDAQCIDACNKPCGAKKPRSSKKPDGDVAGNDNGTVVEDNSTTPSAADNPTGSSNSADLYGSAHTTAVNGCFVLFIAAALALYACI